MTEYERIREEIAQQLAALNWRAGDTHEKYLRWADKILSLDGIEIRADDQTLPQGLSARLNLPNIAHYLYGQEAMLKASFVKVIPKGIKEE